MTSLADKSLLSGGDNKPPMLEKHLYDSWKSRMELYMMNRPHGRMILASVEKGPLVWPSITEDGVTRLKEYVELTPAEAIQADCDIKAINIILQGLPTEIYALVSQHRVAKDLWEKIKLLMQGTSLTKQERECKLYDEFDKFTYKKGETLECYEYYCGLPDVQISQSVIITLLHITPMIGWHMTLDCDELAIQPKFLSWPIFKEWIQIHQGESETDKISDRPFIPYYQYLSEHNRDTAQNLTLLSQRRMSDIVIAVNVNGSAVVQNLKKQDNSDFFCCLAHTSKKNSWKPTGKVFTQIGYIWRPTGRTFTIVGNECPLTRIPTTNEVPSRKPIVLDSESPKNCGEIGYTRGIWE
ncbi:hypothetical protein Tco_0070964 [Tanacetum coccineum]